MKIEIIDAVNKNMKYMYIMWIMNFFWLMVMLWVVEFFIVEQGMGWMSTPQTYCIIACSITKFVLSMVILFNMKLMREG